MLFACYFLHATHFPKLPHMILLPKLSFAFSLHHSGTFWSRRVAFLCYILPACARTGKERKLLLLLPWDLPPTYLLCSEALLFAVAGHLRTATPIPSKSFVAPDFLDFRDLPACDQPGLLPPLYIYVHAMCPSQVSSLTTMSRWFQAGRQWHCVAVCARMGLSGFPKENTYAAIPALGKGSSPHRLPLLWLGRRTLGHASHLLLPG